jgi:hypothetical protein
VSRFLPLTEADNQRRFAVAPARETSRRGVSCVTLQPAYDRIELYTGLVATTRVG